MTFEQRIVVAWSGIQPPTVSKITDHRCLECDEIAEYFGGRSWQQFTNVKELRYHSDALALFSKEAFHYYLPAFMTATVEDAVAADVIRDGISLSFICEFGQAARGRLELFNQSQRNVVAEFLETLCAGNAADDQLLAVVSLLRHA